MYTTLSRNQLDVHKEPTVNYYYKMRLQPIFDTLHYGVYLTKQKKIIKTLHDHM